MNVDKVFEEAKAYAGEAIEEYKLYDFVNDVDLAWELLDLISKDSEFVPWIIGSIEGKSEKAIAKARTDVKTIKANSNRRVQLVKWLRDETDKQPYKQFYEAELEILNAYAVQVIVDLHKANDEVVTYFNKLIKSPHRKRIA